MKGQWPDAGWGTVTRDQSQPRKPRAFSARTITVSPGFNPDSVTWGAVTFCLLPVRETIKRTNNGNKTEDDETALSG